MRADWKTYLIEQGAMVEERRLLNFGDPGAERAALSNSTVITDLSGFGLLSCRGDDAAAFLHSQLSNDINGLTSDAGLDSGYDAMAVFQTASLESGIRLHGHQGPTLTILPLPYAV